MPTQKRETQIRMGEDEIQFPFHFISELLTAKKSKFQRL